MIRKYRLWIFGFGIALIGACSSCTNYSFKDQFMDGTVDYEPFTPVGKALKAKYEANPLAVVKSAEAMVSGLRMLKPILCPAVGACYPDVKLVDDGLAALKNRLEGKPTEIAIVDALQSNFLAMTPEEQRRTVAAVVESFNKE